MRRMAWLMALGVAAWLLLAGCGQNDSNKAEEGSNSEVAASDEGSAATAPSAPATALASAGEPVYGGRYTEPTIGEPSNLIAMLATDSSSHDVADKIFVSPLKYDKDIQLVPEAAESFEVLDGGKRVRIRLRKDIRWTDGEPLTAHDVEFTYKLMIDPNTPTAYSDDFKAISEFRLIDDYTFEAVYEEVFARALLTWALDILPKHLLEGVNLLETEFSRKPVGAGPFMLKDWTAGSQLVLEANPDYFEGRPYIDQIVYRIIPDQSTQFLELKAGNLDFMGLDPKQYLYQTKGSFWDENFQKFKYLSFGYTYLAYNLHRPMFQDVRVRRALTMAIDREEIVKGVLFGLGVPAIGPYKPGTWVYNDKIEPYPYDPEGAKALLAEAGWSDNDGDGLLDKDGQPFAFTIVTNQGNEQRIKTCTIIQQRLAEIGVKVEIRTIEWAAFIKEFINKGNFDATLLAWNILQEPDIFTVWHSSQFPPEGLNFIYYKNAELDELLVAGRSTLDQAERKKSYDRIQEILHEDQPYTFLYVPYSLPIVSARIQDVEVAPAGIGWNFNHWWIPKDRQRFELQR